MYFIYSLAYATCCPSVPPSATCSNLSYDHPDVRTPDFLAPRGTVAVNDPRRDIASSRDRLSLSTPVAQRPNLGTQVGTRRRSERIPGLPYSPCDVTLSTGGCCLAVPRFPFFVVVPPSRTVSILFPSVAHLRPLFEAYRTTCSATSHLGLTGVCVYSPQPPASRDNGPLPPLRRKHPPRDRHPHLILFERRYVDLFCDLNRPS